MFKPWFVFGSSFLPPPALFDKPLHMYNPVLFGGILLGRPLLMGMVTMMPFLPVFDFRQPATKSGV